MGRGICGVEGFGVTQGASMPWFGSFLFPLLEKRRILSKDILWTCFAKTSASAPVLRALAPSIASAPVLHALAPSIVGDSIALHQDCISCHGFGSWRKRNMLWREDKRRLGFLDENE